MQHHLASLKSLAKIALKSPSNPSLNVSINLTRKIIIIISAFSNFYSVQTSLSNDSFQLTFSQERIFLKKTFISKLNAKFIVKSAFVSCTPPSNLHCTMQTRPRIMDGDSCWEKKMKSCWEATLIFLMEQLVVHKEESNKLARIANFCNFASKG